MLINCATINNELLKKTGPPSPRTCTAAAINFVVTADAEHWWT